MARTTVIEDTEVFDSEGTLSLTVNGYDVLYLTKCKPDPDDPAYPKLTDEQHQRIIDVIVEALGTGPEAPKSDTIQRVDEAALKEYKATSFP